MRVGFTGTREGMTEPQYAAFGEWVAERGLYVRGMTEFHHGACVGADAEAVERVADEGWEAIRICAHPGNLASLTDPLAVEASPVTFKPRRCLDRNRDIVNACDVLLACPKGPEELRSGTWSTVRYARKTGKPVVIFWPDGTVTEGK